MLLYYLSQEGGEGGSGNSSLVEIDDVAIEIKLF